MLRIDDAIAQLRLLQKAGAVNCWGWDDESIVASRADGQQIGWADEGGGTYNAKAGSGVVDYRPLLELGRLPVEECRKLQKFYMEYGTLPAEYPMPPQGDSMDDAFGQDDIPRSRR